MSQQQSDSIAKLTLTTITPGAVGFTSQGDLVGQLTFHADGTVTGTWEEVRTDPDSGPLTPAQLSFQHAPDPRWIGPAYVIKQAANLGQQHVANRILGGIFASSRYGSIPYWGFIRTRGKYPWDHGDSYVSLSDLLQLSQTPGFRAALMGFGQVGSQKAGTFMAFLERVRELRS